MMELADFDPFTLKGILIGVSAALIVALWLATGGWALYLGITLVATLAIVSYVLGIGLGRRFMRWVDGSNTTIHRRGGR